MLLRPDQVSELLTAAESMSGPLARLRAKLAAEPHDDAHQAELVALIAALSIGSALPETTEEGAQPPARPDVHCLLAGGPQLMIECLHVGADLNKDDQLRPPLFDAFDQRLRDELTRRGVHGDSRSLSYPCEASRDRLRLPNREQFDAVFASQGFAQFVDELRNAADGEAFWHVASHGFCVEARGDGAMRRVGPPPPDFEDHPVYRGIKRKTSQVGSFAKTGVPAVLFCALTNATPVVRNAAHRGVDIRTACLAAFGVPGVGRMLATKKGLVTHGKVHGSERIAGVIVVEAGPNNYWPRHESMQLYENRDATERLTEAHRRALRHMLVLTHHAPAMDASVLRQEFAKRREAMTWNARPIVERAAEFSVEEQEGGTFAPRITGELQELFAKGHLLDVATHLLHVWPSGAVRDERQRRA